MTSSVQRVPPVPESDWTYDVREVFSVMEGVRAASKGPSANAVLTLANHPRIAMALLTLHMRFLYLLNARPTLREAVILRTSWIRQCQYEWVHHRAQGLAAGLTDAHIDALKAGPGDSIWTDSERTVLTAVDELCNTARLSDANWNALHEHLNQAEVLELIFLVGEYEMICRTFNALRVEVEPEMAMEDMPVA